MGIDLKDNIKPISYIKTNAADMMHYVSEHQEPLIITQNGESKAVLLDIDSYQNMKNAFSLLKMIQLSEKDVIDGRVRPASEVFKKLRRKYKQDER